MRGILFVLITHRVKDFTAIGLKKAQASTAAMAFSHSQSKAKSCAQIGEISRTQISLSVCLSSPWLDYSAAVFFFLFELVSSMHLSYPEKAHPFLMPILKIRCLSNFAVHLGYNCFHHRYVAPWKQERQYLRDRKELETRRCLEMKSCCVEGRVRLCAHHAKLLCLFCWCTYLFLDYYCLWFRFSLVPVVLMYLLLAGAAPIVPAVSFRSCASIDVSVARWCSS